MDNVYEGAFAEMPIAAGFVRHDVKRVMTGDDLALAMVEAVSDSKDPVRDGDIYLGVILPGAEMLADTLGHAVAVKNVKPGQTLTYYAGSGCEPGRRGGHGRIGRGDRHSAGRRRERRSG